MLWFDEKSMSKLCIKKSKISGTMYKKIKLFMNVYFLLQKILAVSKTTINECPCGCETGLDDNHEAHSYSTVSLIKGIVYLI